MKNSIEATINSIDEVTELFYQQKDKEGYVKFEETLNFLVLILDSMENDKEGNFNIDHQGFNEKLVEAMKALEEKDTVLLADILKYEISEMLDDLASNL